jgi:outer membrane protein OmpA-like peptidoglycan-associated protein
MKIHAIALAGVAALALAGPASAGEGWYVGVGVGESWADASLSSSGRDQAGAPITSSGDLDMSRAADVELITGYKWADAGWWEGGFRLESEVGYRSFAVRTWHPDHVLFADPTRTSGHIELVSAFVNAVWDFPIADDWAISLGGGIGLANVDPEIHNKSVIGLTGSQDRLAFGDDSTFTWQLIGGLTYEVDPNVDLQLDYRWQGVGDTSHNSNFAFTGRTKIRDFDVQSVKLTLRWYYCPPEAPPPPPPPPPPEPPKPPMVFIVFFDFDKSNLTAEAQAVVAEAVKAVKDGNVVHVLVTGHTDTVGSHAYNQGLSERRAASVKAEMIRLGMTDDQIGTAGRSFDDPMVQTGPGVREPQNRRAVIELGK